MTATVHLVATRRTIAEIEAKRLKAMEERYTNEYSLELDCERCGKLIGYLTSS